MEIATLIFILSFLAIVTTLAVSATRYMCEQKSKVSIKDKTEATVEDCYFETTSNVTTKWKETTPKHTTRIKLRASRKLRNKRKGHGKGVRGKKE